MDMMETVIPKSDQLNADDLIGGKTMTIKITKACVKKGDDQPAILNFDGDNGKPYKPCKSMRRVLIEIWGKDSAGYVGKAMTLYCDQKVKFGGVEVGGIRISHMSGLTAPRTLALTATKANKKPFTVKPLAEATPPKAQPAKEIDTVVKAAGEAAAAQRVEAYTAWLATLTAEVKETVRPLHKAWSETAKAIVKPEPEEVPFDDDDDEPSM
jgi:hypothetical protein